MNSFFTLLMSHAVLLGGALTFGSPASAQAVLERVLAQIDGATPVSGIFANTADNSLFREITGTRIETTETTSSETKPLTLQAFLDGEDTGVDPARVYIGDGPGLISLKDFLDNGTVPAFVYYRVSGDPQPESRVTEIEVDDEAGATKSIYILANADGQNGVDRTAADLISDAEGVTVSRSDFNIFSGGVSVSVMTPSDFTLTTTGIIETEVSFTEIITGSIDASVTNILQGSFRVTPSTADLIADARTAALVGNIATTALGAVNTGEIALSGATLGLADAIDRAVSSAGSATQRRVNAAITQVGTAADAPVIVLNAALNAGAVTAAVLNVITGMDVEIGRSGFEIAQHGVVDSAVLAGMNAEAISALVGGINTTALGAVNTGAIVSGASRQVAGVVSGIIGSGNGDG